MRPRRRQPPVGGRPVSVASLAAVVLVASEAILANLHGQSELAPFMLLAAAGLAFVPFLPTELRRPSLLVPLVPVIAVVVAPLALISAATFGLALTASSVRAIAVSLALVSLSLSVLPAIAKGRTATPQWSVRTELGTLAFLGGIVVLAATLSDAVVGRPPVPGPDWGHYLLYADRIRVEHGLLIDNKLWMDGNLPFPNDPSVPSMYAAFLLLTGGSAGGLVQGIWLFALLGVLSVFVFCAGLWGRRAGLVAAGLWAALPAGLNTLAWHGLAQTYALALLPLVALGVGAAMRGWMGWRWSLLLGVSGIAILGAHRMTALVAAVALAPLLAVALMRRPRSVARFLSLAVLAALCSGIALLVHSVRLYEQTGGPPDYHVFLARKIDWSLWVRDLTWVVIALGLAGLIALVLNPRTRRDAALLVPCGLLVAPIALSYGWLVEVPLDYVRMGYYVALPLVVASGIAFGRLLPRQALPLALVPIVLVVLKAHDLGPQYRSYYQLVDRTSLQGLSYVQASAGSSNGLVVADRCWGLLSPWLLQRRTLVALEESTISVKQELSAARTARQILYGGARGQRLAARVGARYALLDPKCTFVSGRVRQPSLRGRPLFASNRLLILKLSETP